MPFVDSEESAKAAAELQDKTFSEMTSTELFIILTGGRGVMRQMYLQNIIKEYLSKYGEAADLATMVRTIAKENE